MVKRIEFIYNPKKDKTQIFIWAGQQIIDKLEMNGLLSLNQKKKIQKELRK